MTFTLPDKFTSEEVEKMYIQNILDPITDHAMVIFNDGSAQGNPGPGGSGIVIKVCKVLQLNLQRQSFPMALAMQMNLKPLN